MSLRNSGLALGLFGVRILIENQFSFWKKACCNSSNYIKKFCRIVIVYDNFAKSQDFSEFFEGLTQRCAKFTVIYSDLLKKIFHKNKNIFGKTLYLVHCKSWSWSNSLVIIRFGIKCPRKKASKIFTFSRKKPLKVKDKKQKNRCCLFTFCFILKNKVVFTISNSTARNKIDFKNN